MQNIILHLYVCVEEILMCLKWLFLFLAKTMHPKELSSSIAIIIHWQIGALPD